MNIDISLLWEKIKDVDYIVLRNYMGLQAEVDEGGDIDLLCASQKMIFEKLSLEPRFQSDNLNNCKANIGGVEIPIDVRYVGDNYYDEKWERDMLNRKKRYGEYYVIGDQDEKYSLLYHVLLHKPSISDKYKTFFDNNFNGMGTDELINELAVYMKKNSYCPVIPDDKGVCFNQDNYRALIQRMGQ